MICPHCHREQKDSTRNVCVFCKKNLYSETEETVRPKVKAETRSNETRESDLEESIDDIDLVSLRQLSEKGMPQADYRLGLCYLKGLGCEQDPQMAVRSFTKAAEAGLADAQYALAYCQLQGIGTKQQVRQAIQLLTKAAQQKHNKAIVLLKAIEETYRSKTPELPHLIPEGSPLPSEKCHEQIHFLPDDAANTCPSDQYELTRCEGYLAYYQLEPLERLGHVKINMSCCSNCGAWYLSRAAFNQISESTFDLDGFDILGCPDHVRHESLITLHTPEAPEQIEKQKPVKKRRRVGSGHGSSIRGPKNRQHLAIKLAACDGSLEEDSINENSPGFKGLCTDAMYQAHKKTGDITWCASRKNKCRNWTTQQWDTQEYPCLECHMLLDWQLGSPADGANDAPSHRITGNREGSFVLLTTLLPGRPESERRVFAIFQIDSQENLPSGAIAAIPDRQLVLMQHESLLFWDTYHKGVKTDIETEDPPDPKWGSVFYRNISHDQIQVFLKKAVAVIQDDERKKIASQLLAIVSDK